MKYFKYSILLSLLINFSCEEILFEEDISNQSVILVAPSDNVALPLNSIFFDWENVEDATSYEIQIASPNFENIQQLLVNTTDSINSYEVQLNVGEYQWRVRAKNTSYQTEYSTASFTVVPVENFSDQTVIPTSPEDNLITNIVDQNLQWQAVDGATLYRVQILDNGTISEEQTLEETNIDITFSEGNLIWKVRAENGVENTLYSSREILIDTTSPNIPSLSMPVNGAILTSIEVTFQWTRDAIEGSTEHDTIFIYRDIDLTDLVLSEQAISPFETTLTPDTYYWLVKAKDDAGNESNSSNTFSFTIN